MILTLAPLCLLVLCVGAAFGADVTAKEPTRSDRQGALDPGKDGNAGSGLTTTIFADREKDEPVLRKVMEGLRTIEANDPMMGDAKKGRGMYARIVVRPGTPSKQVAAVVAVLLDAGISKITVEAKK